MMDYLSGKISNDELKDKNIFAVNLNDTVYMIDTHHHNITSEDDFSFGQGFERNYNSSVANDSLETMEHGIVASIITGIGQLLESQHMTSDDGSSRGRDLREKKKKKKKRQFKY